MIPLNEVRDALPFLQQLVYLDRASVVASPRPVIGAMNAHEDIDRLVRGVEQVLS